MICFLLSHNCQSADCEIAINNHPDMHNFITHGSFHRMIFNHLFFKPPRITLTVNLNRIGSDG